ncbi:MAG: hypothetical protein AAFU64_06620 [Bacteroidota bacterium]
MNKFSLFLFFSLFFVACATDSSDTSIEGGEEVSNEATTSSPAVALDESKIYPFMELKELYQQNWEGEEAGNAALDGQTVTLSGEVFNTSKMSALVDGEMQVKGIKIEFRGGEFADPDFGHDVECVFSAEQVEKIEALEDGALVTVKGTLEKQEIYIEPDFKYTVLTLNNCELVEN